MNISKQIIVRVTMLLVCCMVIIALYVSATIMGDTRRQQRSDRTVQLQQMIKQMSYLNQSIYRFTANMAADTELQNYIFRKVASNYADKTQAYLCSLALKKYKALSDMVHSVVILTPDGRIVWDEFKDDGGFDEYMKGPWYQDYIVGVSGMSQPHYLTNVFKKRDLVSSYVFPVVNIDDIAMDTGTIIVHVNFSDLVEPVAQMAGSFRGIAWYNGNDDLLYESPLPQGADPDSGQRLELQNEAGRVVARYDDSISAFTDIPSVSKLLLVIASLILLATVIMISAVRHVTRPLVYLARVMDGLSADAGDGSVERALKRTRNYRPGNTKEIRALYQGFAAMIGEIERRTRQQLAFERKERQLQTDLLYAQINPHFLYNTLNTVIFMAKDCRSDAIVHITQDLINLLQNSLRFEGYSFKDTLGDELDVVRQYLSIQKYKYPGLFALSVDVEEGLRSCLVPHLLLQPLVENSLFHGIRPKGVPGEIWIRCHRQGQSLVIQVSDDGVGIGEENLLRMLDGQTEAPGDKYRKSIGVANVKRRLETIYRQGASLDIISMVGYGTNITITLPIERP